MDEMLLSQDGEAFTEMRGDMKVENTTAIGIFIGSRK